MPDQKPPSDGAGHDTKRTVLIVAFHFPPQSGSSGLLRSLKYCRYLPSFGWRPVVLTLHPRAYESLDPKSDLSVPGNVPVLRSFAIDMKRHLGFRGFYLEWMALPDRWVGWLLGAIPAGLRAIRKYHVDVVFTTFPIATAVLIGLLLHILTGRPWVADFRDSMTEENYPRGKVRHYVWRWIERQAMRRASRVIFTAASTRKMYLERYPKLLPENCLLIANGYDEEDFALVRTAEPSALDAERPLRLLHTGVIYPEERNPRPFFRALGRLKREGRVGNASLSIVLRAAGSEDLYQQIIGELEIEDLVQLQPHVPYVQALQDCADADGLLLFQAANCDHQIPAKAYEYLRLRKPVFALTTQTGDTAALLKEVGGATIVNLADEDDIYSGLPIFLDALRAGAHPLPDSQKIRRYARRNQAEELAKCLLASKTTAPAATPQKNEGFGQ